MPAAIEVFGALRAQFAAVDENGSRLDRPRSEDRLADFRSPGAEQAGEAQYLAVAQRKRRRHDRVGDEVPHLERDSRVVGGVTRVRLEGKLASDHQRDELVVRHRRRLAHAGHATVLHYGHAVGDLEDLRHAVRDVDDGDALRREALDDAEEVAPLVDGQRGGRLVEDQELQVVRETLGDLHHLLLARREQRDVRSRVDVDLEVGKDTPRALMHRRLADHADHVDGLAACIDVLGDAQRSDETALLVDHGDPGIRRALFVEAGHRNAVELDGAAVWLVDAGNKMHERRLAGAVLPDQRMHLAAPDL